MKIACVAASRVPSTTANSIQVMKACHALTQIGHETHLWVPGSGGATWEQLYRQYGLISGGNNAQLTVHWEKSSPFMRYYDLTWKAISQASRWGADIIYTWLPQAALLGSLYKIPSILELHDRPLGNLAPPIFRLFLKHPGKKRVLVITQALVGLLKRSYGQDLINTDVVIAPNGSEPERYSDLDDPSRVRLSLGLPAQITVGYTGHFYPGRGMDLLLALGSMHPDIHFLWVGGNQHDIDHWQRRLISQGIKNITLTGFIDNYDLPKYQSACDILLMPYEQTISGSSGGNSADFCSPMKMFDYLAAGRAIISSDLPVIHEILTTENAVFCLPDDVKSWSNALSVLVKDQNRCKALGSQARRDAEKYSWIQRAQKALVGFDKN